MVPRDPRHGFLGYYIHNGLRWMEPRLLDLNVNGGRRRRTAPTTAMPLAPRLEVDADGKAPAMPPAPGLEVDGDGKAPAMPPAPGLEVDEDGKALGSSASSSVPSLAQIESQTPPNLSGKAASASSSVQGAGKRRAVDLPPLRAARAAPDAPRAGGSVGLPAGTKKAEHFCLAVSSHLQWLGPCSLA